MADNPRSEYLPPGYDEASPYEDDDLSEYPDWWRENIELFRDHNLRPYRPPRFTDGTYVPPVRTELERELGVTIDIRAVNPSEGDNWQIEVNGTAAGEVEKERTGEGFTRYLIDSEQFASLVRDATNS